MELSKPGADLLGESETRLLLALSRVTRAVSGREAARLAGLAQSTARRALLRLSKIGLVDADEEPHAVRYSLNRDHALWPAVQSILDTPHRLEDLISKIVLQHASDVVAAFLFGSVARGDATAGSDVDIAIILPDALDTKPEHLVDALTEAVECTNHRGCRYFHTDHTRAPMRQRTTAMTMQDVRVRAKHTHTYLSAFDLVNDLGTDAGITSTANVIGVLAVNASIAASDAICGFALGQRASGDSYDEAVT